MPAYIIMATLVAAVPPQFVTQALDDDSDGEADAGLFDQLVANAQNEVDGLLGGRYETPFTNPIPAIVTDATLKLVAESLYLRRGYESDKNPWAKKAADARAELKLIGEGKKPLWPSIQRAKPSASAITESAKTTSALGRAAI